MCFVLIASLIVPRLVLFITYLNGWLMRAFPVWWWALIGFIFAPLTTLWYAYVIINYGGFTDVWHWVVLVIALFTDLSAHGKSAQKARR